METDQIRLEFTWSDNNHSVAACFREWGFSPHRVCPGNYYHLHKSARWKKKKKSCESLRIFSREWRAWRREGRGRLSRFEFVFLWESRVILRGKKAFSEEVRKLDVRVWGVKLRKAALMWAWAAFSACGLPEVGNSFHMWGERSDCSCKLRHQVQCMHKTVFCSLNIISTRVFPTNITEMRWNDPWPPAAILPSWASRSGQSVHFRRNNKEKSPHAWTSNHRKLNTMWREGVEEAQAKFHSDGTRHAGLGHFSMPCLPRSLLLCSPTWINSRWYQDVSF